MTKLTFKHVWGMFTLKDLNKDIRTKKELKQIAPDNVYENNISGKELIKRYNAVHYLFKYKFFVPLLWLSKKFLGKAFKTNIEDLPHNKTMKIFNDSFNKAIYDWTMLYRRNGNRPKKSIEEWETRLKGESVDKIYELLRDMKNIVLTVCNYDTAYKELLNILMHEIAKEMHEEYSNKKKYPKGTTHLFYSATNAYDIHYKFLYKYLQQNTVMTLEDAMKKFMEEQYGEIHKIE